MPVIALLVALVLAVPFGPAAAAATELRIARPIDLVALPLLVAERNQLIEKQAAARGLGPVNIHWQTGGRPDLLDALAEGSVDVAAVADLGLFLAAWDRDPARLRALAALARMPYFLVARSQTIRSLRDFGAKDRIAVPVLGVSAPALMLQMAAVKEWGGDGYAKVDPLMVARPDVDAAAALRQPKADIVAHVSRLPFVDEELGDRAVRRVLDSFEIAGPHSLGAAVASARFRDANPALCEAIVAAVAEADALIKKSPGAAAELYISVAHSQKFAVEELSDMLADPLIGYAAAPAGIERLSYFMAAAGRLKHRTASWKDLFFPEAHGLPGS